MWTRTLAAFSILVGLLSSAAVADAQQGPESRETRVRIRHRPDAVAVHEAILGARRRLDSAECREIFSEFATASGLPLQSVLDASGWSGEEYLGLIGFYDGSGDRRCVNTGIAAFTSPGSRTVFICRGFRSEWWADRRYAEIVILHEALHSLGLGENPPSSRDITALIARRCSAEAEQKTAYRR
jgi:hypothetical protein